MLNCEDIFRQTFFFTSGISRKSDRAKVLAEAIIKGAITNCKIRNSAVRSNRESFNGEMLRAMEFVQTKETKIADVFLSQEKKIRLFDLLTQ